jgi:16S rRNA (cytosine1402-N4)-methyltransferase
MIAPSPRHVPVLLREVVAALAPQDGAIFIDGTFGAGGYSAALLEAADCTVWGIDRDPDALADAAGLVRRFAGRLRLLAGRFGDMVALLRGAGLTRADGVALDLGLSSMQVDQPGRGFSFRHDGPLDMRMERQGPSAADLVNNLDEAALADLLHDYGEERRARGVARAIVAARRLAPITRTAQLADIVRRALRPGPRRSDEIDPATRTFQALRIAVNDELGELDRGLVAAETLLQPGGRLAVVSFHSLEDRRVKQFLRRRAGEAPRPSRHLPVAAGGERRPSFRLPSRDPVAPRDDEIAANPRARSARLRVALRTSDAAWGEAA